MLSPPDSPRGRVLGEYVRARVVDMAGINVGLFDHDLHNAIYFYVLNGDEQIYLRYGGRESDSGETYLNLESFQLFLEKGLALHDEARAGALPPDPKPAPFYPREIALLKKNEIDRGRCVECHLINDYRAQMMEAEGTLDRKAFLYRSPDIKTLGIFLDIPKGLVIESAEGAVAAAGLRDGDRITAIHGRAVHTYGDLLYYLDKTPRDAGEIALEVERDGERRTFRVELPQLWWWTDTYFRFWTVEPLLYFFTEPLSGERKAALGLAEDGFASEVTEVDPGARPLRIHSLEAGDIIYAVDGVERDDFALDVDLYLKLNATSGADTVLGVIRDGERMETTLRPERQYYRKRESR